MRVRLVGLLALMALVLASCGGVSPDAAGPSEGIQVHGDWTIDTYNPDGSLDKSLEFENAFFGGQAMASVLSRERVIDYFSIQLNSLAGDPENLPCVNETTGDPFPCFITEPAGGPDESHISANLQVSSGGEQNDQLILKGSHPAGRDGLIDLVATTLTTCPVSEGAGCGSSTLTSVFTRKELEPTSQEAVAEGQLIQVEVVISFTSG